MLWAAGHLDLPDHAKTSTTEKARGENHAWKHWECCKHLQLKGLCCSHGTCSGRRCKPQWQPASRGRRRPRWWRRTPPRRRSPRSRRAFPGACLHKWEPQNSLDATWKTSHRAAGEAQEMEAVIWIKMNTFAQSCSWWTLIPGNNWQLWAEPWGCQGETEHMNTSFNQSQRKVYVPVVWYNPPCPLWGFAMATTEKG